METGKYRLSSAPFSGLFSCLRLPGKDTIPIYALATRPRLGTIGKNHIQSSLSFVQAVLFVTALNLILSLRIFIVGLYKQALHVPFYKNLMSMRGKIRAICSCLPGIFAAGVFICALCQYQSADLRGFPIVRRFGKVLIHELF